MMLRFSIFGLLVTVLIFIGCGKRSVPLGNTRVPADNSVFKNRNLYNTSLLQAIDTAAIYEEQFAGSDGWKSYYKFYPNGNVNLFHFPVDHLLKPKDINPLERGSRGVYYLQGDKIILEIFSITGYGLKPIYGITRYILTVEGDLISLYSNKDGGRIYARKHLSPDFLKYKADW
jgi:hypothetical protein